MIWMLGDAQIISFKYYFQIYQNFNGTSFNGKSKSHFVTLIYFELKLINLHFYQFQQYFIEVNWFL